MTIFLGIILALFIFSVIVFFHELGHFSMAKWFGVRVDEFGIGIPPRAKQVWQDKSGTIYTINWLPIGGFVKMKGEDAGDSSASEPDSLASKSFLKQSGVILAGVVMNFIFAFVIFSTLFMIGIEPLAINTKFQTATETKLIPSFNEAVRIGLIETEGLSLSPIAGGIAERAGILDGDVLLSIDGRTMNTPDEMISKVKQSTAPMNFVVRGTGGVRTISVMSENGKIASYVGYNVLDFNKNFRYHYGFFQSLKEGATETYNQSLMTFELFGNLLQRIFAPTIPSDRSEAVKSLGGPIAVGNLFVDLINAKVAFSVIALIAALISINLGVFNLLPFPALDGGRFAFLCIHRVVGVFYKKKSIAVKIEHVAHLVGFALLILVSIFVAYQDVLKIIIKP